jgi:hypothetical protein
VVPHIDFRIVKDRDVGEEPVLSKAGGQGAKDRGAKGRGAKGRGAIDRGLINRCVCWFQGPRKRVI